MKNTSFDICTNILEHFEDKDGSMKRLIFSNKSTVIYCKLFQLFYKKIVYRDSQYLEYYLFKL